MSRKKFNPVIVILVCLLLIASVFFLLANGIKKILRLVLWSTTVWWIALWTPRFVDLNALMDESDRSSK